jgi:hypothetical protein
LQASPVEANPPNRERAPLEDFILEGICTFDVQVTFTDENYYETTFYNQDGEITMQINSGQAFVTLTSLSSGATLDANISGPGQWTYNPDGSGQAQLVGTYLLWGPENDLVSLPPLALTAGKASLEWDASGNIVDISFNGQSTDVCAALSG